MPTAKESDREILKSYDISRLKETVIKKQNLVITLETNERLNLSKISRRFPEFTRKQPDNLSAAVIRFQMPGDKKKISCNVFGSGKIVATGSKNFYNALNCIHVTRRKISKALGKKIRGLTIALKNIVMTMKASYRIDLEKLAKNNLDKCVYKPLKFPGVIYSLPRTNKPVANIFKSGSVVIPGPAQKQYALECCACVYDLISKYPLDEEQEKLIDKMNQFLKNGPIKAISKKKPKKIPKSNKNFFDTKK